MEFQIGTGGRGQRGQREPGVHAERCDALNGRLVVELQRWRFLVADLALVGVSTFPLSAFNVCRHCMPQGEKTAFLTFC